MSTRRLGILTAVSAHLMLSSTICLAQVSTNPPAIHIVYMGGNDCPPCVIWRGTELPKLQQSAEFKLAKFSYVTKAIKSTVPPAFFLPDDVKPLKAKLDLASGGLSGSPQVAVLVNGEVYDYYRGSRSADEVASMLEAIRTGTKYPFDRCLKRGTRTCEIKA